MLELFLRSILHRQEDKKTANVASETRQLTATKRGRASSSAEIDGVWQNKGTKRGCHQAEH